MSLWESFRTGLHAIGSNSLRSLLTMLGIIIGVASVITMVAVGAGAQQQIAEQIRALGVNTLLVYSKSGGNSRHALIESDTEAISDEIPEVSAAAPFAWKAAQIVRGNKNMSVVVWGTRADYFLIRQWPASAGRYFLPEEEQGAAKVLGGEGQDEKK